MYVQGVQEEQTKGVEGFLEGQMGLDKVCYGGPWVVGEAPCSVVRFGRGDRDQATTTHFSENQENREPRARFRIERSPTKNYH